MLAKPTRLPITLQPPQRHPSLQGPRSQILSTGQQESTKKKIKINRKVVPKITIHVDELIRDTFSNLACGKLQRVTDSSMVLNNDALIEYIRAIYETYDIEDPMVKYGRRAALGEQRTIFNESAPQNQQGSTGVDELVHSRVELIQRTAEHRHVPSGTSGTGTLGSDSRKSATGAAGGERTSSKSKINRLKQSIREGGAYQPIEVKTITLSTQKKSSASIKKKIMFGSPSPNKKDSDLDNTYGQTNSFQKEELSTSQFDRLSQSQRLSHPGGNPTNPAENSYEQSASEISPTFRYCFMCECSILEANITLHEKNCRNFIELYNMNWQDIVRLLENKIAGIKQCITNVLNSEQESSVQSRIRDSVTRWMDEVKTAQDSGMNFNYEYEAAYGRIVRLYQTQSFRLLELTYKLKWFLRIRERIKDKFGI